MWKVGMTLVVVVLAAAACDDAEPADGIANTPAAVREAATAAEDHEKSWAALSVDSYRIVWEVRNLNGMGGNRGDGRFEAVVRNGATVECDVLEAPFETTCLDGVTPVDLLFTWVNERFDPSHTTVDFDPAWHFPESIRYDVPGVADEEYLIRVTAFDSDV